jgi:TonB family protein
MSKLRLMTSVLSCFLLGSWLATETSGQASPSSAEFPFPEASEQIPFLPVKESFTVEPKYTEEARKAQLEGTVTLYVEVPPYGIAENVRVLRSLDMGLEEKAVEAVRQWRFEPATRDGQLVTAATIVLVDFHLPAEVKMTMGPANNAMTAGRIYRVGADSGVTSPKVLSRAEPTYTEQARDAHRDGVVVLYVEITSEGRPQNIQILRGVGLGLDESAQESLRQWTFKPAIKDGKPVTVMLMVEVNFSVR